MTRKTRTNRTLPMEEPSAGINLTRTFDNVSPTTTLYEIIAAEIKKMLVVIHFTFCCKFLSGSLDLVPPNKPLRNLSKLQAYSVLT